MGTEALTVWFQVDQAGPGKTPDLADDFSVSCYFKEACKEFVRKASAMQTQAYTNEAEKAMAVMNERQIIRKDLKIRLKI